EKLLTWKGTLRGAKNREAGRLLDYVTERRSMIKYPGFLEQGRDIGSGPTGSMCRATAEPIKGGGMRWEGDNAEGLMALEALERSGEWKVYWPLCLRPAA